MKTTVIKRFITKSRKLRTIVFTAVILVLAIVSAMSVTASASVDMRVENYNICEQHLRKLDEEIKVYSALDKKPDKDATSAVSQVISEYKNEIIALQTHPDVESRSLESEILLSYAKGLACARLAWIYHYNASTLEANDKDAVYAEYESCIAIAKSAMNYASLIAESDTLSARLNSTVYSKLAQSLSLPTDSLSAKALILGATEEFKQTQDPDATAPKLRVIYEKLEKSLPLQRARDALLSEIKEAFSYVRPAEIVSNSPEFALFAYNLEKATSLPEMNSAALTCLKALISQESSKPYCDKAKEKYLEDLSAITAKASEKALPADFSGTFDSYPLTVKKATVKDSIYALCFGDGSSTYTDLQEIESEFNATNGRIDLCLSSAEVDSEFTKAKAKLFLYKHSAIYEKSLEEISAEDETAAKNALIEYTELETETKTALLSEINIIAEKYNLSLRKKITSLMPNDELYLELCESIINELKIISRKEIDVFYNKSSKISEKAFALSEIVREYKDVLKSENFNKFTKEETEELDTAVKDFSFDLGKISLNDLGTFSKKIEDAKAQAIRRLVTAQQCATVRLAARESENPAVLEEVSQGQSKIRLCTTKGEIITQANHAIFKINRLLTSDEISARIELSVKDITDMQFLTSQEQLELCDSIELLSSYATSAKSAESTSSLEGIWQTFLNEKENVLTKASAIDLSRATAEYVDKIADEADKAVYKLKSFEFISESKSDEICNLIVSEKASSTKLVSSCKTTVEILEIYSKYLEKLESFLNLAESADLEGYKLNLLLRFNKYTQISANYSDENYSKILQIIEETKEALSSKTTKESSLQAVDSAILKISAINDLLADEKDKACASLSDTLSEYKSNAILYSEENLKSIETVYNEAVLKVNEVTDIANLSSVGEILLQYTIKMKEINKDRLYTSTDAMNNLELPSVRYPDGYDTSNGLWGSIQAQNSIISDATFNVTALNASNQNELEEAVREAAKKQTITSSSALSEETLKLLSSSKILTTLNLSLSKTHPQAEKYTLKILMPTQMLSENVLGFAVVSSDGSVAFYPTERIDALLCTDIDGLSTVCLIAEGTVNVSPLLIFLIFLLAAEFIVLSSILYIRLRKKKRGEDIVQNLPMAAFFPAGAGLTRVLPENGLLLAVFLSIAALALGLTIVLLVKNETKEKRNAERKLISPPKKKELLSKKNPAPQLKAPSKEEQKIFCAVGAKSEYARHQVCAQIDLDTIADNFDSGETVNMETLKYKGLVSNDAEYVKILAKGKLTKPLRIEANEFSTAAKKILEMSGGEAKEIK